MTYQYFKKTTAVVQTVLREVERKHLPLVSAGLAYYFLMSMIPALALLTAVVAYLPWGGAQGFRSFMAHVVPSHGLAVIDQVLTTLQPHRTGLLSFSIVATLWLVSKSVKGVISGLDIVYDVHEPRSLWLNRVFAFGLTCGVGLLMLLGITLTVAGPALESVLSRVAPVQSLWTTLWPYAQWFLSATTIFAAIELLYLLAPNVPARRRITVPGAVIAAAIVLSLSWALSFYFYHFGDLKLSVVYGTFATLIALIIWLHWSAAAILIGAEINVNIQLYKLRKASEREQLVERRADAA
jgi:membrane protein